MTDTPQDAKPVSTAHLRKAMDVVADNVRRLASPETAGLADATVAMIGGTLDAPDALAARVSALEARRPPRPIGDAETEDGGAGLTRLVLSSGDLHPDETPESIVGKHLPMRDGSHDSETFYAPVLAAEAVEGGIMVTIGLDARLRGIEPRSTDG